MILTRKLALGVAGVVATGVLGTAGVAAATADSTPTPAASSAPSAPTGTAKATKHRARAAIARGLHGEWVVKGKDGPVTLVSVRGQVTAVGPASVTVKAEDGFTATFTATADTKVRGADARSLADVKVGAKGVVVGVKSGNTTTARTVLVRK
ncbi:MAG TPA: hypothetical protein VI357_08180 [Mycobacteriales bacterium]